MIANEISLLVDKLNNAFYEWESHQEILREILDLSIAKKLASPHSSVESIQPGDLLEINISLSEIVGEYNEACTKINSFFKELKSSVIDEGLQLMLDKIKENGGAEKRKLQRVELNDQCLEYIRYDSVVKELKKEIPLLEEKL